MTSTLSAAADPIISPELVLVADPETASRARAALQEPLSWRLAAEIRLRAAADAPVAQPSSRRSRRGVRVLRYGLVAAGLAAVGYGFAAFAFDGTASVDAPLTRAAPSSAVASRSHLPVAAEAPPAAASTVVAPTAVAPTAVAPRPVRPTTASVAVAARPAATTTPSPPPSPSGFVPARTWTWPPVAGVSAYVVLFLRNGHEVFRGRVQGATFRLPSGFRFLPGRYRWTVTAAGAGRPLIDSSFLLDAAQAAAANAATR
jgi:hypothetical protein